MVGKVVVLVDEEINPRSCLACLTIKMVQLLHAAVLPVHFLLYALRQILCVHVAEIVELCIADRVHCAAIVAKVCIDDGEVEVDDEILVTIWRRVLTDIEITVEPLELVLLIYVVIVAQHRHGQALAEAAWAYEEEELVCSLHFLNKPRFVNIIAVVLADCHEVHHSVWYALCFSVHF